ncbi:hypothetical protein [Clostridium oryzae]|uniref:Uncharacterized protein n=1 Tax=Clostridium oryzae TaxID=1450648 RepID=A0A1V4IVG4_9CLOT|nr:hypothetical protein [Clostridium oryzae]OPJ63407.1 hypothetical protein CLORY_11890 [Clostridium oryzae]
MSIGYYSQERYEKIINIICGYKGIEREELKKIMKDIHSRYIFFLLLKKYKCYSLEKVKDVIDNISDRSFRNNVKKAEAKFFTNKQFRDEYLEIEQIAKKIT